MKKLACSTLAFLMAFTMFFAMGAAVAEGEVTLTFWRDSMTTERTALYEEMIAEFMESHPGIKIEFTAMPDNFNEKLVMALTNDVGPDIFCVHDNAGECIGNEWIIPLDPYFGAYEGAANVVPGAIEAVRALDLAEGKMYIFPESSNIASLWIRPDWFLEAGLSIPETWEDIFTGIPLLTSAQDDRYGLAIRGGKGSADTLQALMHSYSGITNAFDEKGVSTLNDPKNVEFAERYLGCYNVYTAESDINSGWTELAASFQSGKSAIIAHNLGSASGHTEAFAGDTSKYMAIGYPKCSAGYSVMPKLNPTGMAIASTCQHPEEAWTFISWMCSGEQVSRMAKLWGHIPLDMTVQGDQWIQDTPWMKMGAELLANQATVYFDFPNYLVEYNSILNEAGNMIQNVMAGEMTAQEMCDEWAALLTSAYQEQMMP